MCRIPTRTGKARRAGVSGPLLGVAHSGIPIDEFAMAWDQAAALPVCDLLGVDAGGFELDANAVKGAGCSKRVRPRCCARWFRNG